MARLPSGVIRTVTIEAPVPDPTKNRAAQSAGITVTHHAGSKQERKPPKIDITTPVHSGSQRHKSAHQRLLSLSDNLPPIPGVFDATKSYRVRLTQTIPVPGDPAHMLRPSSDVVVSGEFAQAHRDFISGAKAI